MAVLIRHKVSRKEREVSSREWETISSNRLLDGVYVVVKTIADVKSKTPQTENAVEEDSKPIKKA